MADVIIPESVPCQFDAKGWVPCKKPSDNGWCSEHEKAKCSSCGKKAVRSCDAQMGGLMCGSPLCGTCEHGRDGTHITKEVADEIRRQKREEEEALVASRTSPEQRMNKELGVPATLFELLKGDWRSAGYELRKVYFLELKHNLMGFFPAVFSSDTKRLIITSDLTLMERVWRKLEPRKATLHEVIAYVNQVRELLYIEPKNQEQREECKPRKLLSSEEFNNLVKTEEEPFMWMPGLIGGESLERKTFLHHLTEQARKLGPAFRSAAE